MKSFDSTLLVFEAASTTTGFVAHEEIASVAGVRILDASQTGDGRFVILASGPAESLETGVDAIHAKLDPDSAIVDQEILEKIAPVVLESAFSLLQQRLEESLVVVETETVSGCFAVVHALVTHHGLKPIELRIRRSSQGAHAYLTGSATACGPAAEEARTLLKVAMRKGSVEWFEKPSAALKSRFDFV
ncbi:MAG: hypothetical protein V4760_01985 [Bdellovibrionota bacterium]